MSRSDQVPLAGLCLGHTIPIEHIRALVIAGRLPPPSADDLVPRDYLTELDLDPVPNLLDDEWNDHLKREVRRYRDGRSRLLDAVGPEHVHRRTTQLMRIASAAWGAALALAMERHDAEARVWFHRAAICYRRSLADAEPGSWGRCVAPLKALLLANDLPGARRDACLTLQLGAIHAPSTIARYAAALSLLVLDREGDAAPLAAQLEQEDFPNATAVALSALARHDGDSYASAIAAVLTTFETRDRFLEDVPVADTVMTLQTLARLRKMDVPLISARLPADDVSSNAGVG